jgi:hypothetical protein
MAKSKINLSNGARQQFNAAGRIVRELAKFPKETRQRILDVVMSELPALPDDAMQPDPRRETLPGTEAL